MNEYIQAGHPNPDEPLALALVSVRHSYILYVYVWRMAVYCKACLCLWGGGRHTTHDNTLEIEAYIIKNTSTIRVNPSLKPLVDDCHQASGVNQIRINRSNLQKLHTSTSTREATSQQHHTGTAAKPA